MKYLVYLGALAVGSVLTVGVIKFAFIGLDALIDDDPFDVYDHNDAFYPEDEG